MSTLSYNEAQRVPRSIIVQTRSHPYKTIHKSIRRNNSKEVKKACRYRHVNNLIFPIPLKANLSIEHT